MFGIDDAIIAAGIGGTLSLIGGQMSNDARADQANRANAFSAQQFATRYQTTVKDMKAAGLNPMLAYSLPDHLCRFGVRFLVTDRISTG